MLDLRSYQKWYLDAVSELNQLPDPWCRIWAIHLAKTTHMTTSQACQYVRNRYWQQERINREQMSDAEVLAILRDTGMRAEYTGLAGDVEELKRAVWQAIPKPVRDFYTRHEHIIYPCAAVSLLVLVLVGIFGPQFVD